MSFDATKLIVGEKYRMRDGGQAEFVRFINGASPNHRLLWVSLEPNKELVIETAQSGSYMEGYEHCFDVVSSDPIREPVKIPVSRRFLSVHGDGDWFLYETKADMDTGKGALRIGTYELPSEIEVMPID